MELSGALSNPFATDKDPLIGLIELRTSCSRGACNDPDDLESPRSGGRLCLDLVTRVPQATDRPLRACEVYAAASALYGRSLLWHSVKGRRLSLPTPSSGDRRFRSVGYGIYEHAPRLLQHD
jgi:hypothetical protein